MNWRYQHTLLAAAFLACFSNNASRLVISPVLPNVIDAFDLSKSVVGLALTGMWAIYALLQFPSGVIADRVGDYRVILVSLVLTGLGSLFLALSPSFFLFGVAVLALGAGAGLYFVVGTSMLVKSFRRHGQVLGVHSAAGPAAGLVAPAVAAAVSVRYGWRPALLLGAVLSFLGAAVFLRHVEPVDGTGTTRDAPDVLATTVALLKRPSVLYMTFIGVTTAYTWQSFTTFFPTFLVEYRGLTLTNASLVFGVVFLLSAVTQPVYGRLSDRFARETVLALVLSTAVVGFGVVVVADPSLVALVGVGLLGFGFGWGGVFQSRFMDLFSDAQRGTAYGLVRTIYMFVGSLGSAVTGILADTAGWAAAYGVVGAVLGLAVVCIAANRALDLGL
ncbi:MFS transporter [Halomarina pelagica]|uniref:MFS transporter n=1 Tax=Halomarina pelagica TaxID=2961599 RepID=UPI0020C26522|nr:MFS transporter [Halomarina sp. BND7]